MAENNGNSTQKLVGLNQFDRLVQSLNAMHEKDFGDMVTLMEQLDEIKADKETLQRVEEMFGGKSLRYLTQEEYDALSDEEKKDETIAYNITDGENEIDFNTITIDSLNTTDKTLVGAINELELESFETKAELIHLKENALQDVDVDTLKSDNLNTVDKTIVGAINEVNESIENLDDDVSGKLNKSSLWYAFDDVEIVKTDYTSYLPSKETIPNENIYLLLNTSLNFVEGDYYKIHHQMQVVGDNFPVPIITAGPFLAKKNKNDILFLELKISDYTIITYDNCTYQDNELIKNDGTSVIMINSASSYILKSFSVSTTNLKLLNGKTIENAGIRFTTAEEKETWNNKADKSELFSGSYNDLKDKPDIPSVEGLATESFVEQQIGEIADQLANKADKIVYTYRKKEFNTIVSTTTTYPKSDYEFEGRMEFVVGRLYRIEMHNSNGDIFTYDRVSEEITNGYGEVSIGLRVFNDVSTDGAWAVDEVVDVNNTNRDYSNLILTIMGFDTVPIAQYPIEKIVISEIEEVNTKFFELNKTITEDERTYWNNKQDKESDNLNTVDKTIVGAINELELESFKNKAELIALDEYKLEQEDLPCYDSREYETVTFNYDGNLEGKETVNVGEGTFVKLTSDVSIHDLDGLRFSTITLYASDGTEEEIEDTVFEGEYLIVQENVYMIGSDFAKIMLVLEDAELIEGNGINMQKGLWISHISVPQISVNIYIKSLTYNKLISGELKKLDEKYLENKPGVCSEGKIYTYTIFDDPDERTTEIEVTHVGESGAESFNKVGEHESIAIGACSHAEGADTIAYGYASHSEGCDNVALGSYSHVEGLYNYALGAASHAEGSGTSAMRECSHAEGDGTIANGGTQHVQGKYNIKDTEDKYAHIVGNGRSKEQRSNAHTLDWDGNAWFAGKATVSVQPTSNNDLTTKLYVDNAIAQASIGGEIDTSGFALKTELPTKTSQLTNDSGFITSIPSEYVTSSELQQTLQPYDEELGEIYDLVETDYAKKDELFSGNYNDLMDKPCYDTRAIELITYIFDGQTSDRELVEVTLENGNVLNCIKIDDLSTLNISKIRKIESSTGEIKGYHISSGSYMISGTHAMDRHEAVNENVHFVYDLDATTFGGAPVTILVLDDSDFLLEGHQVSLTKGLWTVSFANGTFCTHMANVTMEVITEGELKCIDTKYTSNKPGCIVEKNGEVFNDIEHNKAGAYSHAEGLLTEATGTCAHAEGYGSKATGNHSHVEGYLTTATGACAHAEGYCSKATGNYSHAEGHNALASGIYSHAEGYCVEASGDYSHAEGRYSKASGEHQHVQGKFNIEDNENKYAHIVGNGEAGARSNAHTLDWNGNAWFAGKATVSAQPTDNNDLTTKLYVDQSIAQANETQTGSITQSIQETYAEKAYVNKSLDKKQDKVYVDISSEVDKTERSYINNITSSKVLTPNADNYLILNTSINLIPYKTYYMYTTYDVEGSMNSIRGRSHAAALINEDDITYVGQDSMILYDNCTYTDGKLVKNNGTSVLFINKMKKNYTVTAFSIALGGYELLNDDFFLTHRFVTDADNFASQDYVNNAIAELREEMVILEEDDLTIDGLVDESFPSLTTEDKTLIGAINEINSENESLQGQINEINSENESLQSQINELFQNVSSGKELIASAITDKGVDASEEETFQSLSEKINLIPSGPPGSNIIGYINEENEIYVSLTELESGTYTLKFEDYAGLLNEFDDIGTVEVE